MVGAIPPRYSTIKTPIEKYFAMARGLQRRKTANQDAIDVAALEMTKVGNRVSSASACRRHFNAFPVK